MGQLFGTNVSGTGLGIRLRLSALSWLQFAVWGTYLTSMGGFLARVGLGPNIGWFYSVQGIVCVFMPAVMGAVADRFVSAERLLGFCHALAAAFMLVVFANAGGNAGFVNLFVPFALSTAFYMPTIALANSVSYASLKKEGLAPATVFPKIRVFGTVGFIASMLAIDLLGMQHTRSQFLVAGVLEFCLAAYSFTLPHCPANREAKSKSLADALGLKAFLLFRRPEMAVFFGFAMFMGVSLHITNGYANPFITSFGSLPEFRDSFFAGHANLLISISQASETLCILLIPFFMRRFKMKTVILIAMVAWVFRFGLFAVGSPVWPGIAALTLSMLVYGVAFDFFNIAGSIYVENQTDPSARSGAQGVFMMMTNGLGATVGTLGAQWVVNQNVYAQTTPETAIYGWRVSWMIFALYAVIVAAAFALSFKSRR